MSVLLAVDVGGSGMRSVVCRDGVRGPVTAVAGARIATGGMDVDALLDATAEVLPADADVLVFAARGIVTLTDPVEVRERLAALGAGRTVLCSDAIASLVGAIGDVRPGAVVAAGTGAVGLGCDFAGGLRRVDGWGHVLGDRGSAAWMGLETLKMLLAELDRPGSDRPGSDGPGSDGPGSDGPGSDGPGSDGPGSDGAGPGGPAVSEELWAAAHEVFGPELVWPRQVMTRADAPALLASLAPALTALSVAGDPVAGDICRRAGAHLAGSLSAAAAGLPAGAVLSWTGGLLEADPIRESFLRAAADGGLTVQPPAGTSLDGALLLARAVADGREPTAHPPYLITG